jgi:serine/threonine-protein kinase HipA
VSTVPYIPRDQLGLTFGESRSLSGITTDQLRRFIDKAGLPASPVGEIVRETVARTVEVWGSLDARDLLPPEIRAQVDRQIEAAARGTEQ